MTEATTAPRKALCSVCRGQAYLPCVPCGTCHELTGTDAEGKRFRLPPRVTALPSGRACDPCLLKAGFELGNAKPVFQPKVLKIPPPTGTERKRA